MKQEKLLDMEEFVKSSDFVKSEDIPLKGAEATMLEFVEFQESKEYGTKAVCKILFDGEEKNISLNKTSCRNIALGVGKLKGYGTDTENWREKPIFLTKQKTQVGVAVIAYPSKKHYEKDMEGK